ncbi:class I SAM-dependent methyltransferase [Oxyplasma meridianum]|uniref:Class I SAM-dependent methyltransferase n=1 Tax=Oxyplasma meridianum TaxID=3073602 RepID=A0AAX4NF05_9ARCH
MGDKEKNVREIFNSIQEKYDFIDTLISMGQDERWRRFMVKNLNLKDNLEILDCGAGTGKLTRQIIEACRKCRTTCLDVTDTMFRPELFPDTKFILASAEKIPMPDESVDRVVSAFLTRNLENVDNYFKEVHRVLKRGGIFINMDIFHPKIPVYQQFFSIYFYKIMPIIGNHMTKSRSYTYLAQSVRNFYDHETLEEKMVKSGISLRKSKPFMLRTVYVHIGFKA